MNRGHVNNFVDLECRHILEQRKLLEIEGPRDIEMHLIGLEAVLNQAFKALRTGQDSATVMRKVCELTARGMLAMEEHGVTPRPGDADGERFMAFVNGLNKQGE